MTPLIENMVVKIFEQMPTTAVLGYIAYKLMSFIETLINHIVEDDKK